MAHADYLEAVRFLCNLDSLVIENDDELIKIWVHRRLPLAPTDTYETQWSQFADETGVFVDIAGARFRVEPKPDFLRQCLVTYQHGVTKRELQMTYQALIIAKITWRAFLTKRTVEERDLPSQASRQAFVSRFLSKVPNVWREVILIKDLHLEDSAKPQWAGTNTELPNIYNPLTESTIRVISIRSALEDEEPIECSLHEVPLDCLPDFEALSYVWGNQSDRGNIYIDGARFSVTKNLYIALKNMRKRDSHRTMWIDAICINQSNIEERQAQVALMDAIYKGATEVVVWVGPETATSSLLLSSLETLHGMPTISEGITPSIPRWEGVEYPLSWGIHFTDTIAKPIGDECPECRTSSLSLWSNRNRLNPTQRQRFEERVAAVNSSQPDTHVLRSDSLYQDLLFMVDSGLKLLERPYWGRMWVLQEVILARKLTVWCGRQSADWIIFVEAVFALLRLAKKLCWGGNFNIGSSFEAMHKLQRRVAEIYPFVFLRSKALSVGKPVAQSFATFLSVTAASQATDPRDKVYGLLGLLPQGSTERLQFQPNYSQSPKRLFIGVTRYFLDTTRTLDVLTSRPSKTNNTSIGIDKNLPSWVPNWTASPDVLCNAISMGVFSNFYTRSLFRGANREKEVPLRTPIFQAGPEANTKYPHSFSRFDEVFDIYGVEVDEIASVHRMVPDSTTFHAFGELRSFGREEIAIDQKRWKELVNSIYLRTLHSRWNACQRVWGEVYGPTDQSLQEAFWRTLFLDRFYDTFGNPPKLSRIPGFDVPTDASKLFNHAGMTPYEEKGLGGSLFPPQNPADRERILNYMAGQNYDAMATYNTDIHGMSLPFVMTRSGYIGIGHNDAAVGDKVVVLRGGCVPYILREYSEGNTLVGEWYVPPSS